MHKQSLLLRDCPATAIPSGREQTLPAGTEVIITQTLGGSVTVRALRELFRVAPEDVDAIQGQGAGAAVESGEAVAAFSEQLVWDALKTCYDPEIPLNIVDLGLVYDLAIEPTAEGRKVVEVKMTLTAPGCGMGPVIAEDARAKIAALPTVERAVVHIVWDPVWNAQMISAEGRQVLGLE
jgi:probable FeS assembly SUF system protein SufT